MSEMNNVAIITARGGSKRIPRKNLRMFAGKPIISYAISAALNSKLFKEVMVSTEDAEIADIARYYGASVPFMRSREKSDDYATTADVLEEVLAEYQKKNISFETGCCIYPTAAFVTPEKLQMTYQFLVQNNFDTVVPVVPFGNSILRSLKIQNGKLAMNFPEFQNRRSQDLPPAYYDSGQFYWFKIDAFKRSRNLYSDNTGAFEINEMECHDIDTEQDWHLAELKFKLMNNFKIENT
jgi:pseudaminic acid cytidylyltransferase